MHSRRAAARGGNPAIVTVNDPLAQVDEDTTVAALLHLLGQPDRGVAVALNWSLLPRSSWNTGLSSEARLEVVTAVQAG